MPPSMSMSPDAKITSGLLPTTCRFAFTAKVKDWKEKMPIVLPSDWVARR